MDPWRNLDFAVFYDCKRVRSGLSFAPYEHSRVLGSRSNIRCARVWIEVSIFGVEVPILLIKITLRKEGFKVDNIMTSTM